MLGRSRENGDAIAHDDPLWQLLPNIQATGGRSGTIPVNALHLGGDGWASVSFCGRNATTDAGVTCSSIVPPGSISSSRHSRRNLVLNDLKTLPAGIFDSLTLLTQM